MRTCATFSRGGGDRLNLLDKTGKPMLGGNLYPDPIASPVAPFWRVFTDG
ncbi:hypothetical protein IQ254_06105 [Nodosilinea sp. LEGE 07088]|nr:hypothetical protein [Nodosilinea sp. LEGE 07088]MBE9136780.1 hypothetical protein [Nodosilinea sp. LEGE 07088]